MLGVVLLYVGIVLISNGMARLFNINDKSVAIMNIFTGGLSVICNIIVLVQGQFAGKPMNFYSAGTGLLFGFTYLYVAFNTLLKLDTRLYGWYSLFVAINSIPAGILCFKHFGGDWRMGIIWFLWGILWLTGFIECVLKKTLGKFVGYLGVFEGIVTAWIPGFLMLISLWN
ncbi:AmiS/UreI family transporter [Clostridium baratii]|uniref:AmiS/UreI family transporter n=1 Tax=Clostridium baratii TaxID=1561 RepID=UPI0005F2F6F9|nr:AmiS/UreI family transporter [Clostridium baratii]KJU72015.1 acid-activated urea channel [Clostridium baratii]